LGFVFLQTLSGLLIMKRRIRGTAVEVERKARQMRDFPTKAEDGGEQQERDTARDAYLAAGGYTTLRFKNAEVLTDLAGVVARIDAALPPGTVTQTPSDASS
jgi:Protein of unknown function (DUF559)